VTASPSRRSFRAGQRVSLVLILASLVLTGCLGNNGSPQAGSNAGQTDHSTTSRSVPPDSPTTSSPPGSAAVGTSRPPATIGTISPPATTKQAVTTVPSTSTTTAPPNGNTPDLVSVTPSSGQAGDQVTLSGSGFFSGSGMITVLFGQVSAGVSCPTRNVCQATVPQQPTPGPVTVTVTTDTGTSQPVTFTYS
jgi:IPT/TIG domain